MGYVGTCRSCVRRWQAAVHKRDMARVQCLHVINVAPHDSICSECKSRELPGLQAEELDYALRIKNEEKAAAALSATKSALDVVLQAV